MGTTLGKAADPCRSSLCPPPGQDLPPEATCAERAWRAEARAPRTHVCMRDRDVGQPVCPSLAITHSSPHRLTSPQTSSSWTFPGLRPVGLTPASRCANPHSLPDLSFPLLSATGELPPPQGCPWAPSAQQPPRPTPWGLSGVVTRAAGHAEQAARVCRAAGPTCSFRAPSSCVPCSVVSAGAGLGRGWGGPWGVGCRPGPVRVSLPSLQSVQHPHQGSASSRPGAWDVLGPRLLGPQAGRNTEVTLPSQVWLLVTPLWGPGGPGA